MDVTLLSTAGLAEDAIISIRAGVTRRQGAISSGKPFRFPKATSEADNVMKIDIMQKVASGYLVLKPHQAEGRQYNIVLDEKQGISCEVEVKVAEGEDMAPPVAPEESTAVKAKDAKDYMDKKGLLAYVQGVLQVVVKEQPEDPFSFMAKHFLSDYGESARPVASPKTSEVAAPPAAPAASGDANNNMLGVVCS
jgi:hypothetical protein